MGNIEKVPAGAGTAAAVKKTAGGEFLWWRGAVGKGNGPLWVDWVMEGRGNLGNGEGRGREEKGSCWSEHCCGSGKKQIALLREQTLLRQWGNTDSAPAGADTAAAVGKYRKGSCRSGHYCGSGEIQKRLLRERALLRQ